MSHSATHNPRAPRAPGQRNQPETPEVPANPTTGTAAPEAAVPTAQTGSNGAPQEGTAASPAGECGEHFTTKLRGGGTKDNTCTKPLGHGGPHGKVRVEIAPVRTESLTSFEFVPDDERVEYGAGQSPEERSEQQKSIDRDVKTVYDEWVRRGKPTKITFNQHPRGRYFITPEEDESYRKMLRSSGRLHGVKVKMPAMQKHTSGQMMIVYAVVDLPVETVSTPPVSVPTGTAPTTTVGADGSTGDAGSTPGETAPGTEAEATADASAS